MTIKLCLSFAHAKEVELRFSNFQFTALSTHLILEAKNIPKLRE